MTLSVGTARIINLLNLFLQNALVFVSRGQDAVGTTE
jgi:hypothetical protein